VFSLRSVKCSLSRAAIPLPSRTPFRFPDPVTCSTPPSTCTSAHNQCYFSTHQHSRTNPTPHTSPSVVPLPSSRTIQIQHTRAVRRGAASCRVVLGSCPVAAAVRAAAQVPSTRSRPGWSSAAGRPNPGEGRSAQRVSPVARMSGHRPARRRPVRLVRSGRGDVRPTGRADVHASGVQASGASRSPDGQASGVRGAAAALSGPRWTAEWLGVVGRPGWAPRVDVPVVCGRRGRLPASGRAGGMVRRWPRLARTRVDRGQGRRLAGVPAAAPPWPRRADTGAGPGLGCRPGGGGAWDRAGAHRPGRAFSAGRWCGADHGPGPGGGDHAGWSLGEGGPVASNSGGPTRFGGGAACGRDAAAAREERCPLAADRSLTSENSGGRDRV
jgi:hypothetical protein